MNTHKNVLKYNSVINKERMFKRKKAIQQHNSHIPIKYRSEISTYVNYCKVNNQEEQRIESILDFMYHSIDVQRVKKSTWEKRLAAVKKYLFVEYSISLQEDNEAVKEIATMRSMYKLEENADLIKIKGKMPIDKDEILGIINELPVREKAICLVHLITANRPSEMVRLTIQDFDLEARIVSVYIKKQNKWHNKRLTREVVGAVREYVKTYNLKPTDYFVGRTYKSGRYESSLISESSYARSLFKWTGLTGYNLRKSQVVSMHALGADLPTIAKQTGHQSLETISKHYLEILDTTVDKYI